MKYIILNSQIDNNIFKEIFQVGTILNLIIQKDQSFLFRNINNIIRIGIHRAVRLS